MWIENNAYKNLNLLVLILSHLQNKIDTRSILVLLDKSEYDIFFRKSHFYVRFMIFRKSTIDHTASFLTMYLDIARYFIKHLRNFI